MDNKGPYRTFRCCNFMLVGPPTVVRHSRTAKHIIEWWIVNEEQQDFPSYINIAKIVPSVLWRYSPVPNEDKFSIDLYKIGDVFGPGYIIITWMPCLGIAFPRHLKHVTFLGRDTDKRNRLDPCAVWVAGSQSKI